MRAHIIGLLAISLIAISCNSTKVKNSSDMESATMSGDMNSAKAAQILQKIGNDPISATQGAKEIKKVSNVTHDGTVGSISMMSRADMFPYNGSKGVYSLPSLIIFPSNPAQEKMVITHHTVKVTPIKYKKVMSNSLVKSSLAALKAGAQSTVEYDKDGQKLVIESSYSVGGMDAAGLETFFRGYISNVAKLNRYIEKATR